MPVLTSRHLPHTVVTPAYAGLLTVRARTCPARIRREEPACHLIRKYDLTWANMERVTRIELELSAWEADVLPLNYTRTAPAGQLPRRHRTGSCRLPSCCSPTGTSALRSN